MFITRYGKFDGNSWEDICQICFKQKYGDDYREIKASPGDFGIEGFTSSGKVFQCYSPNENYDPKNLFEKQRDKIKQPSFPDFFKISIFTWPVEQWKQQCDKSVD